MGSVAAVRSPYLLVTSESQKVNGKFNQIEWFLEPLAFSPQVQKVLVE